MSMVRAGLVFALSWSGLAAVDDRPEPKKPMGCEIGAEVPAFYVREITGNRPNLAVCLVCQNGHRPVVLVAVRKLDAQVERLLEDLDRTMESHRADGLRSFAIFLSSDAKELKDLPPRLMTLARERKLALPLAIPVESTTGPAGLALPSDVQTTILFYEQKKITARRLIKTGDLTSDQIKQIVRDAERMVSSKAGE